MSASMVSRLSALSPRLRNRLNSQPIINPISPAIRITIPISPIRYFTLYPLSGFSQPYIQHDCWFNAGAVGWSKSSASGPELEANISYQSVTEHAQTPNLGNFLSLRAGISSEFTELGHLSDCCNRAALRTRAPNLRAFSDRFVSAVSASEKLAKPPTSKV